MTERNPSSSGAERATPAKRPPTGIPGLTPKHLQALRDSGISDEVIKARGYRSVTNEGGHGSLSLFDLNKFGFANHQRLAGLLIPSYDADGHPSMYQLRPDKPRLRDKKPVKYETPAGHALRLDFPPGCNVFPSGQLGDMSVPIVFTEGVKKVDAATANGLLCIGLMGVDGWSGPAARRDFDRIPLNKRRALITFDSDVMTKPEVQAALERFEEFLSVRGAKVGRVILPSSLQDAPDPPYGDPDKVGLDDYFGAGYAKGDFLALAPMEIGTDEAFERRVEEGVFNKRIKTEVDLRWASERAILQSGLSRHITAGTWLFDEPVGDPIWGNGPKILWALLQAVLIVSADGLGKTSVAQQLCLHLLGVRPPSFLGFEVKPLPEDQIIVYLAMDRPEQARQSMLRMVSPTDKEELDRRCHLWQGPMPISVAQPGAMADWLQAEFGEHVGAVVVDTYKDFGLALSDDAVGIAINSAMQEVIARGIQWLGLTHPTKDGRSLRTLEDVYGSRHLFSGCGSVLGLRGAVSGTTNVELAQLKTPIESVFPLRLVHDHATGTTMRRPGANAIRDLLVEGGEEGVGEDKVCLILFGHDGGEEGSKHKDRKATRRQLEKLEEEYPDSVSHKPGQSGGKVGGGSAARWFAKPLEALNVEFGVSGEVSWE